MKPNPFLCLLSTALFTASIAGADVTLVSSIRSGGFKGMGAFDGQSEERIQGDKSHSSRTIKYQSALMRMAAGGDSDQIVRVDLDKVWSLSLKKKTYTEHTISHPPIPDAKETAAKKPAPGAPAKEEKPTHRLKKADFTVKKTGDKKEINGFKAERYLANATIEVEEIATSEVTTFLLDTNIWATPWTKTLKQARDEQAAFAKAYIQKMGLSFSPEKNKGFDAASVKALLGVGGPKTEETLDSLKKKIDTIEGYPVATETVWTMKEDPRAEARHQKEAADAKAKDAGSDDNIDTSNGASSIAGSLMGNFAKKKMKQHQEQSAAKRAGEPMLSTYTEVKSVSLATLAENEFDVPAGFKKITK